MHVLVVDDEILARQRLVRMINSLDGYQVVGEAADGIAAVDSIEKLDPDIVLLDIRMPGEDGLAAAKLISAMTDPPAVIFCTAYDQYALQAFETLAVGYLLKPVREEQLVAALEKATRLNKVQRSALTEKPEINGNLNSRRQHISAKTRRGLELIPINDIHCFIADQKYVTVVHQGGETLIDDTLKELEQEFPEKFIRIHRNALVAIQEIEGMERTSAGHYEIKLKTSDFRPVVSRRHVANVRETLVRL